MSTDQLDVPNELSRAISRESFASDASILSASVWSHRGPTLGDDDLIDENDDDGVSRNVQFDECNEDIFERVLECSMNLTPGVVEPRGRNTMSCSVIDPAQQLRIMPTLAEKSVPRKRSGALYKSFSESNVNGNYCSNEIAQLVRCGIALRSSNSQALLSPVHHASSSRPQLINATSQNTAQRKTIVRKSSEKTATKPNERMRTGSITGASLFPRLPKELSTRIRDELQRKITKAKEQGLLNEGVDMSKDEGRPITRHERNLVIFHWLQSVDDENSDL